MATFTFRHGNPIMIDHTAASDITAGDLVSLGNLAGITCGVAHKDIADTELGAIAVGGGVYDVKVANTNVAVGDKLHYDSTLVALSDVSTNNSQFGFAVEATTAVNTTVKVLHFPYVPI